LSEADGEESLVRLQIRGINHFWQALDCSFKSPAMAGSCSSVQVKMSFKSSLTVDCISHFQVITEFGSKSSHIHKQPNEVCRYWNKSSTRVLIMKNKWLSQLFVADVFSTY